MKTMPLLLLASLWLLAACDAMRPRVEQTASGYLRMPPPPLDSLRAAPETLAVADARIAAGAFLSLNRMPGPVVPGDKEISDPGTPLVGQVDVHTVDDRPLPPGMALEGAWLLVGDSAWALPVTRSDTSRAGSPWIARRVGGGPGWLREGRAEVIVRVRRPDGGSRLVRARGVRVDVVE